MLLGAPNQCVSDPEKNVSRRLCFFPLFRGVSFSRSRTDAFRRRPSTSGTTHRTCSTYSSLGGVCARVMVSYRSCAVYGCAVACTRFVSMMFALSAMRVRVRARAVPVPVPVPVSVPVPARAATSITLGCSPTSRASTSARCHGVRQTRCTLSLQPKRRRIPPPTAPSKQHAVVPTRR